MAKLHAEQSESSTAVPNEQAIFEWLQSKYVQTADARQQAMGLVYMKAETHDLARELTMMLAVTPAAVASDDPVVKHLQECVEHRSRPNLDDIDAANLLTLISAAPSGDANGVTAGAIRDIERVIAWLNKLPIPTTGATANMMRLAQVIRVLDGTTP